MKRIDVAGFERKFRTNIDPWNYRHSRFEQYKRRQLLRACGCAKRGRGLELGCANGETTRELARLCLTLTALDGSPTALAEARRRNDVPHIKFTKASLPGQMPAGPFDLIVASEIAYYLPPHEAVRLGRCLVRALAPGGRVIVLHHRRHFSDAAQHAALAHRRLCNMLRHCMVRKAHHAYMDFDVATFEQRRSKPHFEAVIVTAPGTI